MHIHNSNQLLNSVGAQDWLRWKNKLEPVEMKSGEVVFQVGEHISHLYFPVSCIISLTSILQEGSSVEIAMIGSEGVAGSISSLMGDGRCMHRELVIKTGSAYRLNSKWLKQEFDRSIDLQKSLLFFTHALITQISQVSACNNHHRLEHKLIRWLLLFDDRSNEISIRCTQESLANLLGVRRERIAKAASKLQTLGLIQYARGHIKLLDRQETEAKACECYRVIQQVYEKLTPQPSIFHW